MPQPIDWIAIARKNPGVVDQHIQLDAGRLQLPGNAVDQARGCHVQFESAGPCAFGIELAAGFLKRPQRAPCEHDTVSIFKKQPGGFESESAIGSGDQGGFLLHVGKSSVVVPAGIKLGKSLSQDRGLPSNRGCLTEDAGHRQGASLRRIGRGIISHTLQNRHMCLFSSTLQNSSCWVSGFLRFTSGLSHGVTASGPLKDWKSQCPVPARPLLPSPPATLGQACGRGSGPSTAMIRSSPSSSRDQVPSAGRL
jgi:hypothetical protein